ncbi:P-loop containing nucleoside triphosphate hydrolase protein [Zopfochytrium polystomum]|nr:P-loop containing nucleoside triphosphate hydrolase protein [Zopfochytrium polystomum]
MATSENPLLLAAESSAVNVTSSSADSVHSTSAASTHREPGTYPAHSTPSAPRADDRPFLTASAEGKHDQERRRSWHPPDVSPEATANPFSFLVFSWMNAIFLQGYRKPLGVEDLYPLAPRYHASGVADTFERLWKEAKQAHDSWPANGDLTAQKPPKKPTVTGILVKMFGTGFFPIGLSKFIADCCNASSPLILQALIKFVADSAGINPPPIWTGLIYALAMFILNSTASIGVSFFFQRANAYGVSVRAALTAATYRKALRLSGAARQTFNAGRVTNIISTDLPRFELFLVFFHLGWTFPVIVTIIVALLVHTMGPSALAGVVLLFLMAPLQVHIIRWLVALRKRNASTTDQRIKWTAEVLGAMRVIKFFGWEDAFEERILDIRAREMKAVASANLLRSFVTASGFGIPVLAASVSYMVYAATSDTFDSVVIFTALALFNQLRNPIMWTPQMISTFADASVAIQRIQELLDSEELEFEPTIDSSMAGAVSVENGSFAWDETVPSATQASAEPALPRVKDSQPYEKVVDIRASPSFQGLPASGKPTINDINLNIPSNALVAIVGSVGSGKSSLLSSIIGQMKPFRASPSDPLPKVTLRSAPLYAPQQPWILNSTLRENVLFNRTFDKTLYQKVLAACALEHDLTVLPGGDGAEIGERGINLSGGQKQRVSLARVAYGALVAAMERQETTGGEVVLLDDPLSAVDAHVGKHIFEECISGILKDKTRLFVTHQLHFVPRCDIVITVKDGAIAEYGTYAELMAANGEFAALMRSYAGVESDSESESHVPDISPGKQQSAIVRSDDVKVAVEDSSVGPSGKSDKVQDGKATGRLMAAEDRQTGQLQTSVFVAFAVAMGGPMFLTVLLVCLLLTQATRIATDLWLTSWTSNSYPQLWKNGYIFTYFALSASQALSIYLFSALVAVGGIKAARSLHVKALWRVLRSPVGFFDTNPLGRLLNRFSRDQDIVDNTLSDAVRLFCITFATALSTFGLVCYATSGWFLLGLVPLMVVYYFVQELYRRTARELKRLDAVTRSPLYAHVAESMTGVATIRAYREQPRFIEKTNRLIDANNAPYYLQVTGARWLGLRLEMIGNVLMVAASLFAVFARSSVSPSLIGLALSYVLQVTQLLSLCIRQYTEAEVQLVSIERLNNYATELVTEPPAVIKDSRPPANWPSEGRIVLENVSMRYAEGLPLVLKSVSLEIGAGEKVGIVGRTGSGKSSLMLALFRLIEPCEGSIFIDGVSTTAIGLFDLRSRLSIIPQDPVLFSGTVRSNLDPFGKHNDLELWDSLDASGLKMAITVLDGGLDARIDTNGENLSVGQRQLMCLARALLRKPKLIVLDECTANVDLETDYQIQMTLRTKLEGSTILTIAHRLNTVVDYDKILVLDGGRVVEYDEPANLLDPSSKSYRGLFAGMVDETGDIQAAALRAAAMSAAMKKRCAE